MNAMVSKNKTGLALGLILGLWHLMWSVLVAVGLAQVFVDWIFHLHFIQPPYRITAFRFGLAAVLIAVTTVTGYVSGWVLAAIWNLLQRENGTH
jgi:hypothetical protein